MSMTDIEHSTPGCQNDAAHCQSLSCIEVDRNQKQHIAVLTGQKARYLQIEAEIRDKDLQLLKLDADYTAWRKQQQEIVERKDHRIRNQDVALMSTKQKFSKAEEELTSTQKSLEDTLIRKERESQALKNEFAIEKRTIIDAKHVLDKEMEKFRAEAVSAEKAKQELECRLAIELPHAQKALADAQEECKALERQHSKLTSERDYIKDQYHRLTTKHDDLLSQYGNLKPQHDQLKTKHNDLKIEHNTLTTEHNTLKVEHDKLKTGHKAAIAKCQADLADSRHHARALEARHTEELGNAKAELERKSNAIRLLEEQLDAVNSIARAFSDAYQANAQACQHQRSPDAEEPARNDVIRLRSDSTITVQVPRRLTTGKTTSSPPPASPENSKESSTLEPGQVPDGAAKPITPTKEKVSFPLPKASPASPRRRSAEAQLKGSQTKKQKTCRTTTSEPHTAESRVDAYTFKKRQQQGKGVAVRKNSQKSN